MQIIVIEPGTVATPMWGKGLAIMQQLAAGTSDAQQARYRDLLAAMIKQADTVGRTGSGIDPADAAQTIADAIQAHKPRPRYLVGRDAKLLGRMARLLPDRALDRLIARNLGLRQPRTTTVGAPGPPHEADLAAR